MRLRGSMIFRKPITVIMFDACEEIMIPIIHPTCNVRAHQGLLILSFFSCCLQIYSPSGKICAATRSTSSMDWLIVSFAFFTSTDASCEKGKAIQHLTSLLTGYTQYDI